MKEKVSPYFKLYINKSGGGNGFSLKHAFGLLFDSVPEDILICILLIEKKATPC